MNDLITLSLKGDLLPITRPEDIVYRRDARDQLKRKLKALCEAADLEEVEYCKANGIKEITVSDTAKVVLVTDKKEKWYTEEVYDYFGFTPIQRAILEKSPNFRKKELAKAMGDKADVKELYETTYTDKLKLVELDSRYV